MVTVDEETQAKEFLKRAEVRTMRKDLRAMRETDALKERDKIAKIKTLEEQLDEKKKSLATEAAARAEKTGLEEVLTKNEGQERIAEKDLKSYATEQERQQIFLLESQRLGFEKQIDAIDKEKDPTLKLDKNKWLLSRQDQQNKLNAILAEEKKMEDQQKFITETQQTTTIPSQRQSLEQSRWDLDKKIQDIEKKRWEAEKQVENTNTQISKIDASSNQLIAERSELKNKVLGVDKLLRDIYSVVMAREEDKRRGQAQEEIARRETIAKSRAEENQNVQREQWTGASVKKRVETKEKEHISKSQESFKEKLEESSKIEEKQRKKFIQDVQGLSDIKDAQPQILQKNAEVSPVQKAQETITISPPLPPVPHKK